MEKVISHNERLSAIWVNTNNIDLAKEIAGKYLNELKSEEHTFKIRTAKVCKNDASQTKIEYTRCIKKDSDLDIRQKEISKQLYSVTIEYQDGVVEDKHNPVEYSWIERGIVGLDINKANKIINLPVNKQLVLNIRHYLDEYIKYTFTRIS